MGSFLESAGRKTKDIRQFLREASSGSSLKYRAQKGHKDFIYIPFRMIPTTDENGNQTVSKEIIAMAGALHEWRDDKGYKGTICLKDVVRTAEDGTLINDGTCPFCDTVQKSWDIYRYRLEQEQLSCGKTGTELENYLKECKNRLSQERKTKEAREYIYLLAVVYRTDPTRNYAPVITNGIPEFDLKVMKLSANRIENLQKLMENAGVDFVGSEIVFDYPNVDDARLVVSQSTAAPVFESRQFIKTYPGLENAINEAVDKFEWNGIEKSFPEWEGMTSATAKITVDNMFKAWDNFQRELETNPNARYLEYVGTEQSVTNPTLGQMPAAPQLSGAQPGVTPEGAPQVMPGVAPMAGLDVNALFGGAGVTPMQAAQPQVQPQVQPQQTEVTQLPGQATAQGAPSVSSGEINI